MHVGVLLALGFVKAHAAGEDDVGLAEQVLLALRKASEDLTQQFGRPPTEAELAERLGVSADDMQEARQADLVFSTYSLDAPLSDRDDPALLADMLGGECDALGLSRLDRKRIKPERLPAVI